MLKTSISCSVRRLNFKRTSFFRSSNVEIISETFWILLIVCSLCLNERVSCVGVEIGGCWFVGWSVGWFVGTPSFLVEKLKFSCFKLF